MPAWTSVADHLPGLTRQGFNLLAPADFARAEEALRAAGFEVRQAAGTGDRDETVRAICAALETPGADTLDGFAAALQELTSESGRVALIWTGGDQLLERDLAGWLDLVDVLTRSGAGHRPTGGRGDRPVFETLAVLEGFGVEAVL